jgi:ribonuclease P protein component
VQRQYRLAKREDFSRVYRLGRSAANRQFVVYAMANKRNEKIRVGVSASKKLGGAVVRNRLRRMIKEIVRHHIDEIIRGYDLIVIVRGPAVQMTYQEMEKSLLHAIKRSNLLRPANANKKESIS